MSRSFIVSLVLGCLMFLSAGLTKLMTPTILVSQSRGVKLESIIPAQFGDWMEEKNMASAIVNPQAEALINKIYAQTLSRTYVNGKGERIMLSIAYGADQRRGSEVHFPDVCYPAQGFQILSNRPSVITTQQGAIAVNRLETNLANQRYEPVTYWATIGDEITTGGLNRKMKEVSYGIRGEIPDGLVFRVSSIGTDTPHAFLIQDSFVNSLVNILGPKDKKWLTGLHS